MHELTTLHLPGGVSAPVWTGGQHDGAPVILVLPAMGVGASYYTPLAHALDDAGLTAVVADFPGQGASSPTHEQTVQTKERHGRGYDYLARTYLPALVEAVRGAYPDRPLVALGHSLGGQVLTMALRAGTVEVDAAAFVAAGTVHWRRFGVKGPAIVALAGTVRATIRTLGWWPGHRMGFGGTQPASIMRCWSHLALTGRFPGETKATVPSVRAGLPVLAVHVQGDETYAPTGAIDGLMDALPGAVVTRWRLEAPEGQPAPGHLRWARRPLGLPEYLAAWASEVTSP